MAECAAAHESGNEVHLTAEALAEAVEQARCPRLLVTHLYPGTDQEWLLRILRERTSADVGLARDGLVVEIEAGVA